MTIENCNWCTGTGHACVQVHKYVNFMYVMYMYGYLKDFMCLTGSYICKILSIIIDINTVEKQKIRGKMAYSFRIEPLKCPFFLNQTNHPPPPSSTLVSVAATPQIPLHHVRQPRQSLYPSATNGQLLSKQPFGQHGRQHGPFEACPRPRGPP